jgi:hypothetical protein
MVSIAIQLWYYARVSAELRVGSDRIDQHNCSGSHCLHHRHPIIDHRSVCTERRKTRSEYCLATSLISLQLRLDKTSLAHRCTLLLVPISGSISLRMVCEDLVLRAHLVPGRFHCCCIFNAINIRSCYHSGAACTIHKCHQFTI